MAYIEQNLASDIRLQIENHLVGCSTCRKLFEQVEATYTSLDHLVIPHLEPDFINKTIAKIPATETAIMRYLPSRKAFNRIAAAVLILISIGFGITLGGKMQTTISVNQNNIAISTNETATPSDYIVDNGDQSLEVLFTNE